MPPSDHHKSTMDDARSVAHYSRVANDWRIRALKAEAALVLIEKNCAALANDDRPDVAAAQRLAWKLSGTDA